MKTPRVKSVMTPFPYSVDAEAGLDQARAMMVEHDVRHLPVTQSGKIAGIVTDRDMKYLLGPAVNAGAAIGITDVDLRVRDAYVQDCYTVDLETPLVNVLSAMAERHIGAAVVTAHDRLVGIFTTTDACRAYADDLAHRFHGHTDGPPDAA